MNEGARTPGRGGSSRLQPVPTGRETNKKKEQEGNAGSMAATGGGRKAPRSERDADEGRERGEAARTAVVRGGLATGAATKARGNGASRSVTRTIPLRTYNYIKLIKKVRISFECHVERETVIPIIEWTRCMAPWLLRLHRSAGASLMTRTQQSMAAPVPMEALCGDSGGGVSIPLAAGRLQHERERRACCDRVLCRSVLPTAPTAAGSHTAVRQNVQHPTPRGPRV